MSMRSYLALTNDRTSHNEGIYICGLGSRLLGVDVLMTYFTCEVRVVEV